MKNPPDGYRPAGWQPALVQRTQSANAATEPREAFGVRRIPALSFRPSETSADHANTQRRDAGAEQHKEPTPRCLHSKRFATSGGAQNPHGLRASSSMEMQGGAREMGLGEALRTWQWYALWAMLFLNTMAGISIISQAAPMAQEIAKTSAATAAGLVGIISIANAAGRFLWAWGSDYIGRRRVFLIMFLTQVVMFLALSRVHSFTALAASAFIVLFCYGGGFGTMPAFAADFFGARNVGSIYGLMLTAWGFAGVCGPTLIAYMRQSTGHYAEALEMIAGIMLISAVLPFVIRPPKGRNAEATNAANQQPSPALNPIR